MIPFALGLVLGFALGSTWYVGPRKNLKKKD